MEMATPQVVKDLRPSDIPEYAHIVFQPVTNSFAAYWPNDDPKKKPLSTNKSFSSKVTPKAALAWCVNWFYKEYYKKGGVPRL